MSTDCSNNNGTVSYKLSWEEYFETAKYSLPQPAVGSFIAALYIASAVGIFGVALTYAVDPRSKATASIFCLLSLVLFAASFWDWKIRTKKRIEQAQVKHKQHYGFFADEQTFAFDQKEWTIETSGKKVARLWCDLVSAIETQSTFVLSTTVGNTFVPKRVLDTESQSLLRHLALGEYEHLWPFRVDLYEFIRTEVVSLWRIYPFSMSASHAVGILLFLLIAHALYGAVGSGIAFGWCIAFLLLFLTLATQFVYLYVTYDISISLRQPCQAKFDERGVLVKSAEAAFFTKWICFAKVLETRSCFLLFVNLSRYNIYPKSCISSEQQTALRELLKRKLTSK